MTASTPHRELNMLASDRLHYGQEHKPPVNVRSTPTGSERDDEMIASVRAKGIIQPLTVWLDSDGDGLHYVIDGGRRLGAAKSIAESEGVPYDMPCSVWSQCTAEQAYDASLTANFLQLPLHPVDQFEAFEEIRKGMARAEPYKEHDAVDEIAKQYGIASLHVERMLALGAGAPEVRAAYRAGEINLETFKAFTLESNIEQQAKLFAKLAKRKALNDAAVRHEVMGDQRDVGRVLTFVGVDAYEDAGGVTLHDLFADDHLSDGVNDRALLMKLAKAKLDGACAEAVDAGWAWASTPDELPAKWAFSWERKHLAKKDLKAANKSAMGCVVSIDETGALAIEYGVVKPKEAVPEKEPVQKVTGKGTDVGKTELEPDPVLPAILSKELQRQATSAMAAAIVHQPDVCIAALLAGFAASGNGPVRVTEHGIAFREGGLSDAGSLPFNTALRTMMKKGRPDALKALARVTAASLDLIPAGETMPFQDDGIAALAKVIKAKALEEALRRAFDPTMYFEGAQKFFCEVAILEACGAEVLDSAPTAKAALAKFAIANVPKTGWLPKELRSPGYMGPGAKATKKKAR